MGKIFDPNSGGPDGSAKLGKGGDNSLWNTLQAHSSDNTSPDGTDTMQRSKRERQSTRSA
jgi:hypothetical protein